MVAINAINVHDIEIIYTVFPVIAILFTFLRLWMRTRTAGLWWDDSLAFLAACFTALSSAAGWMHFEAAKFDSRTTKIAAYYMVAFSFYGALWCARLSILYSIIRIASNPQMRMFLHWLGATMLFVWAILSAQVLWVCVPMHKWKSLPAPQCPLTLQVAVFQLVSDILADGFLIGVPVRLFLNSSLEKGTKFRLVIIFSASIMTTIVSIVHAYYLLKVGGADVLIAAIVEISVSVIVCNLSVVVTNFYRMCNRRRNFSEESEEGDATHIRTFGSWSLRPRNRRGEITTIGLTETRITIRKENETFIDMGEATSPRKGKLGQKMNPVVFYGIPDRPNLQKGYLPREPW